MNLFALLCFAVAITNIIQGFYVLSLAPKKPINIVFFALAICSSVWNLGYTFLIPAESEEIAWFWYKFALWGWPLAPGLMVLFVLYLTESLRKRVSILTISLILIPGILISLLGQFTKVFAVGFIVGGDLGTIEIHDSTNPFYLFTNLYIFVALVLSVLILSFSHSQTKSKRLRKQLILVGFGLASTVLLAVFENVFLPLSSIGYPAIGSTNFLFLMIAIWYAISKYQLLTINTHDAFPHLTENMKEYLIITNTELSIVSFNKQLIRSVKLTQEELIGKNIALLFYKPEQVLGTITEKLKISNQPFTFESQLIGENTKQIPVKVHVSVLYTELDGIQSIIFLFQDLEEEYKLKKEIMERFEVESALRKSELRFRRMFMDHSAPMIMINAETGKILRSNNAASAFYGHTSEILKKYRFNDFNVDPNFKIPSSNTFVTSQRLSDGSIKVVEVKTSHIILDNQPDVLFAIIQDVTEQVNAEKELYVYIKELNEKKQLLESQSESINEINARLVESEGVLRELLKTRDKLFSIIGHDLKSPYQAIIGYGDLLINDYSNLDDEEKLFFIGNMREAAQRSFELLENLLNWSRSQTGSIRVSYQRLSANDVLNRISSLFKANASVKNITLAVVMLEDIEFNSDLFSINTILRNFTSNAIRFTSSNGSVTLSAEKRNDQILISVRDSGVGIKLEDKEKLFKLGEKIENEANVETGTGLGLILSKELAHLIGGSIEVKSEYRKGSVFTLVIPIMPN